MQLFKDEISKELYKSRLKQVGTYVSLGLASIALTNDVSWLNVSQETQNLISKVGFSSAIGLTVGTLGYASLHELYEYQERSWSRKIEKTLGKEAFEIIDKKEYQTTEENNQNNLKVDQKESIESIMNQGIEAKVKTLDDIIPTLNEEIIEVNNPPVKKELPSYILDKLANTADDFKEKKEITDSIENFVDKNERIEPIIGKVNVQENKSKKVLEKYILDKLADNEEDLYKTVSETKKREPIISSIIEDIKQIGDKIEPILKQEELTVKNTEIEMNLKRDLPFFEKFKNKKSFNDIQLKSKNTIQKPFY